MRLKDWPLIEESNIASIQEISRFEYNAGFEHALHETTDPMGLQFPVMDALGQHKGLCRSNRNDTT